MRRKSISAKVIRQGTNPLPTTLQIQRSWFHSQITSSDNQNRATFAANDIPAKRHSDALRRNLDHTATLELGQSLMVVRRVHVLITDQQLVIDAVLGSACV